MPDSGIDWHTGQVGGRAAGACGGVALGDGEGAGGPAGDVAYGDARWAEVGMRYIVFLFITLVLGTLLFYLMLAWVADLVKFLDFGAERDEEER